MKNVNRDWALEIVAALTAVAGLFTLSSTLFALLHFRGARLVIADAHLTLISGISLIYLAATLRRGKRNAWLVSLVVFALLLVRNIRHFGFDEVSPHYAALALTNLIFPVTVLTALIVFRGRYRVKSGALTFRIAFRRGLIILAIAFLYGAIGFQLFDHHDFHQEIGPLQAAHYTIDQFGLTTNNQPTAYTRRAVFFVDSLASVSVASLAYVAIAFFAPVRFRLTHRRQDYEDAGQIVNRRARSSEDFFKLWPRDKVYFFNRSRSAVIAYRVTRGVALSVGDPLGKLADRPRQLADFLELCRTNDWRPAFIHTDSASLKLYKSYGLEAQKIGEEALVDIKHFVNNVARNKYFRNNQ